MVTKQKTTIVWSRPFAKIDKNIPQLTTHLLYIIPKLLSLML